MLLQEQIALVVDKQRETFLTKDVGIQRDILPQVPIIENYATIITGIRRCGKSTLLLQIAGENYAQTLFLNFEDIRLATFETGDFVRLLNEIKQRKSTMLFFDEIQLVDGWEIFVHQLLNDGYKVFVTGSNATLLSTEMATHLTGRQISVELFPFSFSEFLKIRHQEANEASLKQYLQDGGMPEYLKSGQSVILTSLVDDIIIKDISVRHSLKDVESLRQLTLFLCANIANQLSANKLINLFGIKSASTILEYFSYLTDAYLFDFVPQFNYSLKTQARNPKKLYSIDTGICNSLAFKFSENIGHSLENAVYLHLRRHNKSIFYFNESGECDFVVMKNTEIKYLIQVCWHLDDMNLAREKNGLQQAMKFFKHASGTIVTFNQKDCISTEDGVIEIIPAYEFFISL